MHRGTLGLLEYRWRLYVYTGSERSTISRLPIDNVIFRHKMMASKSLPTGLNTVEPKLGTMLPHRPPHPSFTMEDSPPSHLPPKQDDEEKKIQLDEDENPYDEQGEEQSTSSFIQSIKKVFAPCVGVVDAASFMMANCRGEKETQYETYDMNLNGPDLVETVMGLRQRNAPMNEMKVQKRQGETLVFHATAGFDDDVSAISSHTLEEMERSRMFTNGIGQSHIMAPPKQPPRTMRQNILPPSMKGRKSRVAAGPHKQPWTMMQRPTNQTKNDDVDDNASNGVSTSGSESSADAKPTAIKRVVV